MNLVTGNNEQTVSDGLRLENEDKKQQVRRDQKTEENIVYKVIESINIPCCLKMFGEIRKKYRLIYCTCIWLQAQIRLLFEQSYSPDTQSSSSCY